MPQPAFHNNSARRAKINWARRLAKFFCVAGLVTGSMAYFVWRLAVKYPKNPVSTALESRLPAYNYRWFLHSEKPYYETRVHFSYGCDQITKSGIEGCKNYTYLICFLADMAGKRTPCVLDTGAANIIWPEKYNLQGQLLNSGYGTGIEGSSRKMEAVLLPSISIGQYELSHIATAKVHKGKNGKGIADVLPILGNFAFSSVVLTIDYKKQELILRDPSYNIAAPPRRKGDVLLNFEWMGNSPTVAGIIEGHPANFLIDSGSEPPICISRAFYKKYMKSPVLTLGRGASAFGATQQTRQMKKPAHFRVGSINIVDKVTSIVDLPDKWDGVIGQPLLRSYNVTIDYPRHKILLRPNQTL